MEKIENWPKKPLIHWSVIVASAETGIFSFWLIQIGLMRLVGIILGMHCHRVLRARIFGFIETSLYFAERELKLRNIYFCSVAPKVFVVALFYVRRYNGKTKFRLFTIFRPFTILKLLNCFINGLTIINDKWRQNKRRKCNNLSDLTFYTFPEMPLCF